MGARLSSLPAPRLPLAPPGIPLAPGWSMGESPGMLAWFPHLPWGQGKAWGRAGGLVDKET